MHYSITHQKSYLRLIYLCPILILIVITIYFSSWFLDNKPPSLTIKGIEEGKTYRDIPTITLTAKELKTKLKQLTISIDGRKFISQKLNEKEYTGNINLDASQIIDGSHNLTATVYDASFRRNTAMASFKFTIDTTPPEIQIDLRPAFVNQGNTLAIFATSNESLAKLTGILFNRAIAFYPFEDNEELYRCLVGVSVSQKPQEYLLKVVSTDLVGNQGKYHYHVQVRRTAFRTGTVLLPPQKTKLLTDKEGRAKDRKARAKAYDNIVDKQLWSGKFIQPVEGRITSEFGARRVYNNGVIASTHLGLDIANVTGTPVKAANAGIVSLAESQTIYGNAVIINHGQDIHSSYNHLNEIKVELGDKVQKGQIIGLVGETGQSTGPHLHWGMVVNGLAVNPLEWTQRDFDYQ